MKRITLAGTVLAMLINCVIMNAQHPVIALQGNGELALFTQIDDAIDAADDGDTLYLPGGSYSLTGVEVDKELHIYGAGHYPDKTGGSGSTIIQGNLYLRSGADSSTFEGIYFNNDIHFQDPDNRFVDLRGVVIRRCNFNVLDMGGTYSPAGGGLTANNVNDILLQENVIRGLVDGDGAQSVIFEKNIIDLTIQDLPAGTIFQNNIFLKSTPQVFGGGTTGCTFQYNIFMVDGNNIFTYAANCIFQENLFVDDLSNDNIGTNTKIDNITGEDVESIFENKTKEGFDYDQDYRLAEGCSGIGAGPGGTDVGIYGTDRPYLDGLTSNPFIHSVSVPATTDAEGKLNIEVKVSAQDY